MSAAALGLILALAQTAPSPEPTPGVLASPAAASSACVACHQEAPGDLGEPPRRFADDVHRSRGLDCSACHGGDPAAHDDEDAAHAASRGFRGAPDPAAIPDFCGRCHADIEVMRKFNPRARVDQLAEYRQSGHGKALATGDTRVATCLSCHGAHGIQPVASPKSPVYPTRLADTCGQCHGDPALMQPYGHSAGIPAEWRASVHGQAVGRGDNAAPSCNGCHGNHGAAPPGVSSIARVCGHCHSREAELFARSPLSEPWARLGLPECSKCHGHHDVKRPTDRLVGTDAQALCSGCHEHGESGLGVAAAARAAYDQLGADIERAAALLDRAERLGMEVSQEKFTLSSARDDLIEARVLVHTFDASAIRAKVDEGRKTALATQAAGEAALDEIRLRRHGLLVSSALILLAVLAIVLKIRQIERNAA